MIEPSRPTVARAKRVVLKLGTRVVTNQDGRVSLPRLFSVVDVASDLCDQGRQVLIVSSGAVGLGMDALGFPQMPSDLEDRQACAAVGQTRLMALYEQGFQRLGRVSGQVLLTVGDFEDRLRYLNLRSTLLTLIRRGVIPIINENDAVSTEELAYAEGERAPVFGDNDRLSAMVSVKLEADLLILLTDVDGLYERDPGKHPGAKLLSRLDSEEPGVDLHSTPGSIAARGGMRSKVDAALAAARAGCEAVIASGVTPGALGAVLRGEEVGTWCPARGHMAGRERWIAFAAAPKGTLYLDAGALTALRHNGASLLAAGVTLVEGEFLEGDVVELRGPTRDLVGRGIIYCDTVAAKRWCGGTPPRGVRNHHALVHRDNLVLEG